MIVPVDKPQGLTSAACVRKVGRAAGVKAGHAGTLDPDATGLLVICLGQSRKLVRILTGHDKTYRATVRLGAETDTLDASGTIVEESDVPVLDVEVVREHARRFTGRIRQRVPAYSAVKRDGKTLHKLARRGSDTEPPEREVTVHRITVGAVRDDRFELEVTCGPGTYVRSLARDLARALGTVGHLAALRRLSSGSIVVAGAPDLDTALAAAGAGRLGSHALDHERALAGQQLLVADREQAALLRAGRALDAQSLAEVAPGSPPPVVLDREGAAVCIAVPEQGLIRPRRVLLPEPCP